MAAAVLMLLVEWWRLIILQQLSSALVSNTLSSPPGMDLYFKRHDGHAVTCDDFLAAMADANGVNLDTLARWGNRGCVYVYCGLRAW